jgi:hypothetical protein
MRVEFVRQDAPDTVVASATWNGRSVDVESDDEDVRRSLDHAYRATPVVVDDASYRQLGTFGEVVVHPGSLDWFRAATQVRAAADSGLAARFVPGVREGGFDPAAQYRSFRESIERLTRRSE